MQTEEQILAVSFKGARSWSQVRNEVRGYPRGQVGMQAESKGENRFRSLTKNTHQAILHPDLQCELQLTVGRVGVQKSGLRYISYCSDNHYCP